MPSVWPSAYEIDPKLVLVAKPIDSPCMVAPIGPIHDPYREHGVETSQQYYHTSKQSDKLRCINLKRENRMNNWAKISIQEGTTAMRRQHVQHFV